MTVKTFEPENTKDTLYIRSGLTLGELLQSIHSHFRLDSDALNLTNSPSNILDDFVISAEHIQTNALGHDQYDSSDYTNFLVIERV